MTSLPVLAVTAQPPPSSLLCADLAGRTELRSGKYCSSRGANGCETYYRTQNSGLVVMCYWDAVSGCAATEAIDCRLSPPPSSPIAPDAYLQLEGRCRDLDDAAPEALEFLVDVLDDGEECRAACSRQPACTGTQWKRTNTVSRCVLYGTPIARADASDEDWQDIECSIRHAEATWPHPTQKLQPKQCVTLVDGTSRCVSLPVGRSLGDADIQRRMKKTFGVAPAPKVE